MLEAKRRLYEAELAELQKREPAFNPGIQSNPSYIKSMARQEAEVTVAQLQSTIARQKETLMLETAGLEKDKTVLRELESLSRALDIQLRVLEKRGGKLRQLKQKRYVNADSFNVRYLA